MVHKIYKPIAIIAILVSIGLVIYACGSNEKSIDSLTQLQQQPSDTSDMVDIKQAIKALAENQNTLLEAQKKLEGKINQPSKVDCDAVKNCLKKTPGQPHPHPTPTPKPPPPPPTPPTGRNDQELRITVNCTGGCQEVNPPPPPPPPPPQVENPLPPPPPQPTEPKVRKVTVITPDYIIKTDSYPEKKKKEKHK